MFGGRTRDGQLGGASQRSATKMCLAGAGGFCEAPVFVPMTQPP